MAFQVKLDGVTQVRKHIRGLYRANQKELLGRLNAAANALRQRVVQGLITGTYLKSRHGTAGLAGSVYAVKAALVGDAIEASVHGGGGAVPYGVFWEGGIKAHDIVPVRAKALAWPAFGAAGTGYRGTPTIDLGVFGHVHGRAIKQRMFKFTADYLFAKRVHIPAQAPRPWFSGTYRSMLGELEEMIRPNRSQMDLFTSE
jgi:hypothetical protein